MRGLNRVVNTSFWEDEKTINIFTPEDKYFFLYLLTNPHTTQLGIYKLIPRQAAFETGYSQETINGLIDRFENRYKVIKYSKDTFEVAIKNFLRHSIVKGGKPVMDCLLKEEQSVEDKSLLIFIYNHLSTLDNLNKTVNEYLIHIRDLYININNKDNDNDNERIVTRIVNESSFDGFMEKSRTTVVRQSDDSSYSLSYSFSKNSNLNNLSFLLERNICKYKDYILNNPKLYESIKDWMEYKDERTPKKSNHYAEKGMKSFLTEIVGWHKQYGDEAVTAAVNHTIANQWQGVVWDWMEKRYQKLERPIEAQINTDRPERFRTCPNDTWQKLKPFASSDGSFNWSDFDQSVLTDSDREWMRRNDM